MGIDCFEFHSFYSRLPSDSDIRFPSGWISNDSCLEFQWSDWGPLLCEELELLDIPHPCIVLPYSKVPFSESIGHRDFWTPEPYDPRLNRLLPEIKPNPIRQPRYDPPPRRQRIMRNSNPKRNKIYHVKDTHANRRR